MLVDLCLLHQLDTSVNDQPAQTSPIVFVSNGTNQIPPLFFVFLAPSLLQGH